MYGYIDIEIVLYMVSIATSKLSPTGGILAPLFTFRLFFVCFWKFLLRICDLCTHVFVQTTYDMNKINYIFKKVFKNKVFAHGLEIPVHEHKLFGMAAHSHTHTDTYIHTYTYQL